MESSSRKLKSASRVSPPPVTTVSGEASGVQSSEVRQLEDYFACLMQQIMRNNISAICFGPNGKRIPREPEGRSRK